MNLFLRLAFSFVIGLFFGVFLLDVANSAQFAAKLRRYAKENDINVRYEAIKADIRRKYDETRKNTTFSARSERNFRCPST